MAVQIDTRCPLCGGKKHWFSLDQSMVGVNPRLLCLSCDVRELASRCATKSCYELRESGEFYCRRCLKEIGDRPVIKDNSSIFESWLAHRHLLSVGQFKGLPISRRKRLWYDFQRGLTVRGEAEHSSNKSHPTYASNVLYGFLIALLLWLYLVIIFGFTPHP